MTRHQTSDATRWTLAAIVLCTTALACPGPAAAATQRLAHDNAAAATHSVAHNKAAADRAAERTMNGVALPPGAVRVGADPEVVTRLTWLHNAVSDTPSAPNVVDLHRFFRVSERPAALFHWLTRHRPRGSTPLARGRAVVHGRTADWSVSFAFRGVRNTITQSGVGFELTSARSGGTALRVEGWAAWFVPRPAFERVPDSAHAVVVSLDGPGPKLFPVSTITDPQSVAELIQFVNSRQLVQPDSATACSPSLFPRIDLRFVPAVGAAPVAHAVADGCVALNFSVGARRGPPLSTGPVDLGDLLWKLHAVPVCTPGQLSGSATPRAGKSEGEAHA